MRANKIETAVRTHKSKRLKLQTANSIKKEFTKAKDNVGNICDLSV